MDNAVDSFVFIKDVEEAEKQAKEYQKAINRAQSLIRDAKARYIKTKTRARSKKAAEERNAYLQAPKFKAIELYERREDIQDDYGWGVISEAERDRFEELWDEREEIKNKTGEDGIYRDLVTQALEEAENTIIDLWTDEISEAEYLRKKLDKQKEKAEADYAEWKKKEDAAYKKIMGTTM